VEAVLEVVAVVVLDQGLLRELRFLRDQFEEREGLETFEGDLNGKWLGGDWGGFQFHRINYNYIQETLINALNKYSLNLSIFPLYNPEYFCPQYPPSASLFHYLNENILIGVNSSEILPLALILAHGHQILQSL
jgi:hypothetical protein